MRTLSFMLVTLVLSSSCAMIAKNNRQQVQFKGGPEQGVTKVITPDGVLDVDKGSGAYLMTRSKADIPIKVICPDGTQKNGMVDTRFDWLAGGLGNWWTYFIGSGVDAFNDKAYDIDNVSLTSYCDQNIVRDVASEKHK